MRGQPDFELVETNGIRLRVAVAGASFRLRGKDRPKLKPNPPRASGASAKRLAVTDQDDSGHARWSTKPSS